MSKKLELEAAPSQRIPLDHVRLQTSTNWGPLGGDTLVKSGGKFTLSLSDIGVHVTLKDEEAEAIIPMANVKFALIKK